MKSWQTILEAEGVICIIWQESYDIALFRKFRKGNEGNLDSFCIKDLKKKSASAPQRHWLIPVWVPGGFLFVPHSNIEILKSEVPRIFLMALPPNWLHWLKKRFLKKCHGNFHASSSQPPALQKLFFSVRKVLGSCHCLQEEGNGNPCGDYRPSLQRSNPVPS